MARTAVRTSARLSSSSPSNDRGEPIDRCVGAVVRAAARLPPIERQTTARSRAAMDEYTRLTDVPTERMAHVVDRTISGPHGDIPLRVYVPVEATRPLPILVYLHGGGFVIGSLDSHDRVVRRLAARASAIVVAVDYRLAPEHRFPVPFEDALAATQWVLASARLLGGDPERVAIGGDSAGGNLSAAVCLALRDARRRDPRAPVPRLQVLVYPATDLRRQSESHRRLGRGYLLTTELIDWFMSRYLRSRADELDPRGSPLLATDHRDLPPAWITIAGFDPLRDEGEAYAAKLRESGVATELVYEPGMIHGFFTMGGVVPRAAEVVDLAARAITRALG